MKVFLLYDNKDFDPRQQLPWNEKTLTQDLDLDTLFNAMSAGDDFLFKIARLAILSGLKNDKDTIMYRQDILKDCLKNPSIIRDIYDVSEAALENRKGLLFGIFTNYPSSILSGSVGMLQLFVDMLKHLRSIADEHAGSFTSEGFVRFFRMLKEELTDVYFSSLQDHLEELKFREGILISAAVGKGNKGIRYVLRKLQDKKLSWIQRLFAPKPPGYTFQIHPRDESGARALSEFKNEGINLVANATAQSADHILNFFEAMRAELAFYVGCLHLHEQLEQMGEPCAFPSPVSARERKHSFSGLYDVCLALHMKQKIVGNDGNADDKNPVIITGANQGGKSTFLRSIGLAQLMMQGGMYVPAESFSANICRSLFTHFKREEDTTMKSGKLDEELSRMSDIVDHITPDAMLLFNESFAATNEREGSEIARQIVDALIEKRIKVFFVTHLYELAHGFYDKRGENALFLRAERAADTTRTFKLKEGAPLATSYGADLYEKIFGNV